MWNRISLGCQEMARTSVAGDSVDCGEIRCFSPENILEWRYIGESFQANPVGRWSELVSVYQQKQLDNRTL
jgi:hypothetical protein